VEKSGKEMAWSLLNNGEIQRQPDKAILAGLPKRRPMHKSLNGGFFFLWTFHIELRLNYSL